MARKRYKPEEIVAKPMRWRRGRHHSRALGIAFQQVPNTRRPRTG
jgi:hypothetical protein